MVQVNSTHTELPPSFSPLSVRSQQHGFTGEDTSSVTIKRNLLLFLIVCVAMVTLIIVMTRVTRRSHDLANNFDWKTNPNIKTGQ